MGCGGERLEFDDVKAEVILVAAVWVVVFVVAEVEVEAVIELEAMVGAPVLPDIPDVLADDPPLSFPEPDLALLIEIASTAMDVSSGTGPIRLDPTLTCIFPPLVNTLNSSALNASNIFRPSASTASISARSAAADLDGLGPEGLVGFFSSVSSYPYVYSSSSRSSS